MNRDPNKLVRAAGILLISKQPSLQFLLMRHHNRWDLPKGHGEADESFLETALRETEEEIGIGRTQIELVGRLKAHDTRTGYRVMPVMGLLKPPLSTVPDPSEVASIFEVPLAFILDPANHRMEPHPDYGADRQFRAVPYGEHYIWGLTARVLFDLLHVVGKP